MTDIERKRELTRLRVARYRERLKRAVSPLESVTLDSKPVEIAQPSLHQNHMVFLGGRWMCL